MKLRRAITAVLWLVVLITVFYLYFKSSAKYSAVADSGSTQRSGSRLKNVLFMITDDMRTQLGCYAGEDSVFDTVTMHTPNLDRLAGRSLLLRRAYAQYTLCCPSRSSMLTGRRPDVTGVLANDMYWRDLGYNFTTLPQYFKQNGYRTIGLAKVFHKFKDRPSWTEYQKFGNPEKQVLDFSKGATWLAYSKKLNEERPLFDIVATNAAIEHLERLAPKALSGEEPFFLALGFNKPHVSFVCPEEFFDLYPLESGEQYLRRVEWQTPSVRDGAGMLNVTVIDGQLRMTDVVLREHRRAYFACISYVDDLVGRVLEALDRLGLANNTIVSFVADHGYHLGENGRFGKNVLTDVSTHVPMMVHVPGLTDRGFASNAIVEALDLYPTIVEASGLPAVSRCPENAQAVALCTQGKSLLPLLDRPDAESDQVAYTQVRIGTSNIKGYSLRTDRYRYTEYVRVEEEGDSVEIYTDLKEYPSELYDHDIDKEEMVNRTSSPDYQNIKEQLRTDLHSYIKQNNGVTSLYTDDDE